MASGFGKEGAKRAAQAAAGQAVSAAPGVFLGLFTAISGDPATVANLTELVDANYARVNLATFLDNPAVDNSVDPTIQEVRNDTQFVVPAANGFAVAHTSSPLTGGGDIAGWFLTTGGTKGTTTDPILYWGDFNTPKPVAIGDSIRFAVDALKLQAD